MKPVTLSQVQTAIGERFHVAIIETAKGVQVSTLTTAEMEQIRPRLQRAGILYNDGPSSNVIICTGVKEV